MLSALARLDIDPWKEAASLAAMPRAAAAPAVAAIIGRLPMGAWTSAEVPGIAARLVGLLPHPDFRPAGRGATRPVRGRPPLLVWILAVALLGAALLVWAVPAAEHLTALDVRAISQLQ